MNPFGRIAVGLVFAFFAGIGAASAQSISFQPPSGTAIFCTPGQAMPVQFGYSIDGPQPPVGAANIYTECCPRGVNPQNGQPVYTCDFTLTDSGGNKLFSTKGIGSGGPGGGTITGQTPTFTLPSADPAAYTLKLGGWCYTGANHARGPPPTFPRQYFPLARIDHSINVSVRAANPGC